MSDDLVWFPGISLFEEHVRSDYERDWCLGTPDYDDYDYDYDAMAREDEAAQIELDETTCPSQSGAVGLWRAIMREEKLDKCSLPHKNFRVQYYLRAYKRNVHYKKSRRDHIPYNHGWYRRKGDDLIPCYDDEFHMDRYYAELYASEEYK